MKLLVLVCLVAAAAAAPKFPLRLSKISQSQSDSSSEEIVKGDNIFRFTEPTSEEVKKLREVQRGKQSGQIKETSSESNEERIMANSERDSRSSSSSEEPVPKEAVPSNTEQKRIPKKDMVYQLNLEQLYRLIKYNQLEQEAAHSQEQFHKVNEHNQARVRGPMRVANQEQLQFSNEAFPQAYQFYAYPFADWFYPPQVQYISFPPFFDNTKPIVSENVENTDVMPVWLN